MAPAHHSHPHPSRARARSTVATAAAFSVALAGLVSAVGTGTALAADRTATLAGTFQDENGCPGDWQPACAETLLAPTGADGVYEGVFTVPAGNHEFKVAMNGAWDEAYGVDGSNIVFTLGAEAQMRFVFDDGTKQTTVAPANVGGEYDATADAAIVADPVRQPGGDERFYFVMTDRFANGDATNDTAGIEGDRLDHGFDPTDRAFYNGGDLRGLIDNLDYIQGLGTTAIWLTPSFKNRPVQGEGSNASAGYHGYWITDFTQIDPHLGTNAELEELIAAAEAKGIDLFFDIITNHTADVISYAENQYSYVPQDTTPYVAADGTEFRMEDVAGLSAADFPELTTESFPYTPVVNPADADVKVPALFNDVRYYHNRGDSTWAGESETLGDFVGLDDLMTEHPDVVAEFVEVYKNWIDLGVDGFRIDTAKHVNFEFWEQWTPQIVDHAQQVRGDDDFFMFGEVYSSDTRILSPYVRDTEMSSVLDFAFQERATAYVTGSSAVQLRDLYASDDVYTTTDTSATALPTFLGNHDMGRIGFFVRGTDAPLERSKLAHSLMYLTRGQPVVYYGDEQGFIGQGAGGEGNDKAARQSLFASEVPEYQNQALLNGEQAGSVDRYDTDTELYTHISSLAALRDAHPALSEGAQIELLADSGLYAFARVDRDEDVEHVVVTNNGGAQATATFATLTPGATYTGLFGTDQTVTADAQGTVSVAVPARGAVVLVADRTVAAAGDLDVQVVAGRDGTGVWGQAPITAVVADNRYQETSFAYRVVGDDEWTRLGTAEDDTPRVFHDVEGLVAEHGLGTMIEYRAVTVDAAGNASAASTVTTLVEEPAVGPPPSDFEAISVPGNHNSLMGCAGDWQPACQEAQLTLGSNGLWSKTFDLPAGTYEFKVAANESWAVNFGSNGAQDGPNLGYTHGGGPITFWFDPETKYFFNSSMHAPMTIPGSHQQELGCPGDWQPDCTATLLTDLDRDGIFTFVTDELPAGSYEAKVAYNFSWDENYGVGGAPGGGNIPFTVGNDGDTIEFRFDPTTKVLTVGGPTVGIGGLGQLGAHWLSEDVLALPEAVLGGRDLADLTFRLHTAPEGGISLDGETPVLPEGAGVLDLVAEGTGLPEDLATLYPHLAGHVVLRLQGVDRADVEAALTGQLVVSATDGEGALAVFTGVQIPGVVDALFAEDATDRALGVTWGRGNRPTVALWAPTAKDVDLLVWSDARRLDREPQRVAMERQADGSWTVVGDKKWRHGAYQFDVTVYVPSTGAVETNRVTDPYSVALTVNSTHSVFLDLADQRWMPGRWKNADQPVVRPVDQTIYELHVRDFSISDETVPAELRGTYAAFTTEGAGRQHLRELQEAGLTTVHLLPTFDIATIEEDRSAQAEPPCDLASFAPESPEQQACISGIRDADGFNWGYDPFHFSTPEGSYAVDAHGGERVKEFRSMVGALHSDGLQVVLDQVFNHTAASGQDAKSVLDRVVPGYYHRLNAAGNVETSTCCQNIATEHQMAEKLMVDSVVTWARDYKVDGFRFDLMGHHSRDNMLAVREALDALTVSKDGVDGSKVYLYGEGWNFGEVANDARFEQARQGNLGGTGIGTFSDRLRDAVRGGGPFDADPRVRQGFGTGAYTDQNGLDARSDAELLADARHQADLVRLGLAGNLRDFEFVTSAGEVQRGDEIDYNGQPAGYADSPEEIITYVDKHDNETLFDILTLKLPTDTPMADRVRMNTVSLATTALSQTPTFFHAGSDLLRSKSLDRNSYNSGDWFNLLDFSGQDNGFARGLPQAGDNQDKWPFMRGLLADASLKPAPEHISTATEAYQDLLELRFSTELFRLGDPELIQQKVTFPGSGADAVPGVIAMHVDDTVGADTDEELDGLLTVFNASDEEVTMTVAELVGEAYALSPVLASGSDEVVKATSWDANTGTVTVPARTVAVLVDPEQPPAAAPVSPGKGQGRGKPGVPAIR
ncbi:alpha-1,6-glucosidase [Actinotalea ferrariae CF5-4]|uniref:Alpha-1,6-glucosidase n=1 Tax=Actinotalea ferrariae CF5-4 TaxID=948458 RepID=A0A021VS82_9CELL|nr:pullulanase-type alpha-1,6-glucosidase [Actinotalea ferrariae]EYR63988.1 alpha-1,6-glucosidase [Actinotalea ferrariae CF5-4]